jgi:GDP-L-fucose synthase
MQHYHEGEIINVGTGEDITIAELAHLVSDVTGFQGTLTFDTAKPDGTPRKLLDVTRLHALGWRHQITLLDGVRSTYAWYLQHVEPARLMTTP